MKIKVERVALKWDDLVIQEQLKSLMYINLSLCGNTKKDNWIDELNFKRYMRFKRKTTRNIFGYYSQKKKVYHSCGIF